MGKGRRIRENRSRDAFLTGRRMGKVKLMDTPKGKTAFNFLKKFVNNEEYKDLLFSQMGDKEIKDYLDGIKNLRKKREEGYGRRAKQNGDD